MDLPTPLSIDVNGQGTRIGDRRKLNKKEKKKKIPKHSNHLSASDMDNAGETSEKRSDYITLSGIIDEEDLNERSQTEVQGELSSTGQSLDQGTQSANLVDQTNQNGVIMLIPGENKSVEPRKSHSVPIVRSRSQGGRSTGAQSEPVKQSGARYLRVRRRRHRSSHSQPGLAQHMVPPEKELEKAFQDLDIDMKYLPAFLENDIKGSDIGQLSLSDIATLLPPLGPRSRLHKYFACKDQVMKRERNSQLLLGQSLDIPEAVRDIRVLSLDGGGVRALVELQMLQVLQEHLQKKNKDLEISDCFDLVCGTGTGGLIAFSLLAGFSLDRIEKLLLSVVKCMSNRTMSSFFGGEALYDESQLEKILTEFFGDSKLHDFHKQTSKAFVTTLRTDENKLTPYLFRSYYLQSSTDVDVQDQDYFSATTEVEGTHGKAKICIKDALLAAMATPAYFAPKYLKKRGTFVGGGLLLNNPMELSLAECSRLWPGRVVSCVVSLGCGAYNEWTQIPVSKRIVLRWEPFSISTDIVAESERIVDRVHNYIRFMQNLPGMNKDAIPTIFRLNPPGGLASVKLDEHQLTTLQRIMKSTAAYCENQRVVFRNIMSHIYQTP